MALAGQPNCGKSTLFNALTGVHQHIANYPGVTVDKKSGHYRDGDLAVELVDLPGTYSLTSFSLEERVARAFLNDERPDVIVNVIDATTLRRGLYLTFQLLEMGFPVVVALTMTDVAHSRGLTLDLDILATRLNAPVIPVVGHKGTGREDLRAAIRAVAERTEPVTPASLNYGDMEDEVAALQARIADLPAVTDKVSARWMAVRLLEADSEAERILRRMVSNAHGLLDQAHQAAEAFEARKGRSVGDHIAACRDDLAGDIVATGTSRADTGRMPLTERIDRVLLNRWLAPAFLVLTVWIIYELSIVQGYELTKVTWPLLAGFRSLAGDVLPAAGFLHDPMVRSLGLWMVDSANALLNYVPIFLILFALIAILEDSGYMARIAFILDRILHRFGLHGQSTLPYILAGVFAGGCAVPGVMATKGIPDQRARMATILTVPFMNCLAKVPLYTLLITIYFPDTKGLILFYLSTITVIFALLIAKLLSVSVLRHMETAPFVMELPHYHLPTVTGVLRRSVDRTWLYIKKVGTVVVAIATIVYVLLQFPGLSPERQAAYHTRAEAAITDFRTALEGNPLAAAVPDQDSLTQLVNLYTDYRSDRMMVGSREAAEALDTRITENHPDLAPFVVRSRDPNAREAQKALRTLATERKELRREMKDERIVNSVLGQFGRALEPVTQYANFDWKINVALFSSFAARESSVATLGVLFDQPEGENQTLEERMGSQQKAAGYTALTAVALMLFFALYPPCLATTIMIRVQTQSYAWMAFSIVFPTTLALTMASLTYSIGAALGLTGLEMMTAIYLSALGLLLLVGFFRAPFGRTLPRPAYATGTEGRAE
ncbi:ferrous iron transport protein B [Roseospira marina]|uniref:ferrous iron transport protein B n=1 Tax=Roseospira marina TaxID=140057 RepID=UPI001801C694|nr:ferrous iron transport protein B [Roseospira marina]MBB4316158.1 ferrous iron transport protein B [Roseospira marina]MBB5089366.1 ferrous iron transport protein B [Roseospira marina]